MEIETMRNFNALVFAITVAILFLFVGLPERASVNGQDGKPAAAAPAPVEKAIAEIACKCECNCGPKLADLQNQIDDLRSKLGELQCKCDSPKAALAPQAPQAKAPAAPAAPQADQCYIDSLGRRICPPQRRAQFAPMANADGIVLGPGEVLVEVDGVPVAANRSRLMAPMFPNLGRKYR